MRRRNRGYGGCYAAFGIGVLVVMAFPARFILIIAAVILVLAGMSLFRCG